MEMVDRQKSVTPVSRIVSIDRGNGSPWKRRNQTPVSSKARIGWLWRESRRIEVHGGKRLGIQRPRSPSRCGASPGLQSKGENRAVAMTDLDDLTFACLRNKTGELPNELPADDRFHDRQMTDITTGRKECLPGR